MTITHKQLKQLKALTERAVDARMKNLGETPTLKVTPSDALAIITWMDLEYAGCKIEIESED